MKTDYNILTFTVQNKYVIYAYFAKKVQLGNDQEKAQSERNSHSKNRSRKKLNRQLDTCTKKTYCKPSEQLFPNRRPLRPFSYLNLHVHVSKIRMYLNKRTKQEAVKLQPRIQRMFEAVCKISLLVYSSYHFYLKV